MTGYEVFGLYQSIKLHFTTDNYDYFKYNGKTHLSIESFEKRKDKWHFYKLSRRLQNKDEMLNFIVANFVGNENTWVGELLDDQSDIVYRQRQKVIQSLSYTFQNDCEKLFSTTGDPNSVLRSESGDYPTLLTKALRKEIEIESVCILDSLLGFVPMWTDRITDTIRWPNIRRKILKYKPFIEFDKTRYKLLLKKAL